jgi:alkanesulfonate monooxygenase SsuD/methylene tetrahydromethanopterin reductase-like flavin-dependent oxidoreductase (luciferase family)
VPFERRGARADEYLAAMGTVWRDDVASFVGEFVSFADVRVNPRPVRNRRIPIIAGGNSDAALRRAARLADGWYGFNLEGTEPVRERIQRLHECCAQAGRDPAELDVAVALAGDGGSPDRERLAALGVRELVLVSSPPADPEAVESWLARLSGR